MFVLNGLFASIVTAIKSKHQNINWQNVLKFMLNAFICVYSTAENIVSEHNKIENETDSYKNAQTNLSVLIEISFGIIAKFLTISSISIYHFIAICD